MTATMAIDLVIGVTILEWPLLLVLTRQLRRNGGLPSFGAWPLMRLLLPGLCLLCVARVVCKPEPEPSVFLFLALAGLFHGLDLWQRFKRELST
ncbi:MAG: hypothetical protein RLY30_483 [Pseudomonadota bacterium]|jgi:hypothetical protein